MPWHDAFNEMVMKSKASLKTHPLHPILVCFPIAFFFGAFIFDLIAVITSDHSLWKAGRYLVTSGIIGGLLAAVPGIIDFIYTVPPESSANERAKKHGLINSTMIVVFVFNVIYRDDEFSYL